MHDDPTHRIRRRTRWIVALVAAGVAANVSANDGDSESASVERFIERVSAPLPLVNAGRGWSIMIDNDLFAPRQGDRDYTGGLAVTVNGAQTAGYWGSLDPLLAQIDRLTVSGGEGGRHSNVLHALQVGLISFTPEDLRATEVNAADRPYASLLFLTSARDYVAADERSSRYSELTLGALGLSLTSDFHDAIHEVVGSEAPRGYGHQISAGGEPAVRYVTGGSKLRGQRLALGSQLLETKSTWELSAGYLTEASYALSTRLGGISSPWWTFDPERVDYIARPAPLARTRVNASGELYVWAGMKLRLRAYNAFLQGQFRHSDHSFAAGELNHVIGEAWWGVTGQFSGGTQVSYAMRYQTAEIREGKGSRDPVWASLTVSHTF